MKKRLLGILLCLCMVLTIFPALAFAEGDEPETPTCACETACALDAMNAECPVCGAEGAVPESCGQYAAPAEDSVCTCETACALGAMNDSCPVCGTDGTVPESCGRYTAPAETPAPEDSAVVRQDLDDTVKQAPADDTDELQTLLDGGGEVKLEKDYTISETLTVGSVITLDLNGHVISMTGDGSVIAVYGGLTLTDSDPTATHADSSLPAGGVITGGYAAEGGGVYVEGEQFTMNAGTIFGCRADRGGGVYANRSIIIMNGGVIEDCSAASNGQAVYMKGNEFIANSGTIKGTVYVADNGSIVTNADYSRTRFYDQVTVESGTIRDGIYCGGIAPGPEVISGPYYTVDFNLNGGSGSIPTQYFVNTPACPALRPADPTKDGYTFAGWYRNEAFTIPYDFEEHMVDENLTLYAKFEDDTEALQTLLDGDGTTVTLDRDYTITKTLTVSNTITLDLNGHVIRMNGSGSVIQAVGIMTLTDSNPTATHDDPSLPAGGVITGGNAAEGGGVIVLGAFIMNGGTIKGCSAASNGQAVYISGAEFIANSGTIKGTVYVADDGRIVTTADYSRTRFYDQVTVESGTIRDGTYYGGIAPGPSVISGSYWTVSFDLNGGSGSIPTQYFVNTTAYRALKPADPTKDGYTFAGWYWDEALTMPFDFKESPVGDNLTLYAKFEDDTEDLQKLLDGGGVVKLEKDYTISKTLTVGNSITLDLAGHVIRMTDSGSVIAVYGALTLTDSNPTATHADSSLPAGGVITGGHATEGGGVYAIGDFTMTGGTIYNCTAAGDGGGVYAANRFTMTGGAIDNCTAGGKGGGVYCADQAFTMTGGAIKGCKADFGGGVFAQRGGFMMTGGAIEDCIAYTDGQAVYIFGAGFLADGGTVEGTVYVGGNGLIAHDAGTSFTKFYDPVTIKKGTIRYGVYYGGIENYEGNVDAPYHTVDFNLGGGSGSVPTQFFVGIDTAPALKPADPTKEGYTFTGWFTDKACTTAYDFNSLVTENRTLYAGFKPADDTEALQTLLNGGGTTVTLDRDYTINKTLTVGNTITLDLAGHVIRMTGDGSVIAVYGALTLTDSNPTATHADSSLPAGGVITGGHAAGNGGGVLAIGEFTMTGGTIYNCTAADNGGGVYVKDGLFTMNGGAIKGCSAEAEGGGVYANRSIIMNDGVIEDCSAASNGQAVYIYGAAFLADGGTVEGTVYVADYGCIMHDAGTSFTTFYDPVTIEKGTIRYGVYYGGIKNYEGNVDAPYHTVDFNLGGGSGSVPTQFFVGIDTAPALKPADPTKEGHTFAGWFTDEACTTAYDFTSLVTENRTLYAGFKAATYTITYDPGEYGTGSIPAGTKEHGKDFTLTTDTFTRQGYAQYAWISAENDWYPLGGTYSTDANVTLYPVWSKIETMTVPFTTTVTLGGSAAPGETVFDLELVDAGGNPFSNDAVTVSGSVTTNGAGSYTGALTLTGPVLQIQSLIIDGNGLFVRQVDAGAAGWTLDGTVWGVALDREESDTTESGLAFSPRIYPVKLVDGKYTVDQNASPVEQMLFANVYTHTHRYTQHFNETEHWDECPCGDVVNKAPHSFTKHHDETDHWDECDCGYAKNKEPHSFGEWVVKTPATATAAGLQERECTGCDYVQSSPIPPLGHIHSYTPQHNDTHHWDECTCGDVQNKEPHSFGDWAVSIRPTGSSTGLKVRSCTVCGYQQTAEIPPLKPTDSPATGDNSKLPLWFALFAVSAAGLALTGVSIRRRRSAKAK